MARDCCLWTGSRRRGKLVTSKGRTNPKELPRRGKLVFANSNGNKVNPDAFDAYLQGHYFFERNTNKDTDMAGKIRSKRGARQCVHSRPTADFEKLCAEQGLSLLLLLTSGFSFTSPRPGLAPGRNWAASTRVHSALGFRSGGPPGTEASGRRRAVGNDDTHSGLGE
jgi:hypothetical protein